MRICLVSREFPPDTGWGGIGTFTKHLAHGLKDNGHDVEVVSLATEKPYSHYQNGIHVHRVLPSTIGGGLGMFARGMPYSRYVLTTTTALWQKFLELHTVKPFDVVDTPELLAEGLFEAITAVVPVVVRLYTPHSKFISEGLHNVRPSFDHQLVAMLERVAMLSADALTSPSEDLADYVSLDMNYPRERIKIIRNPIDPDIFTPIGPCAIPDERKPRILFVGRLEERKGIHYFVDAIPQVVSKFPNVQFVILGDDTKNGAGQTSVLAELKARIARYGVERYIQWIPRVPLETLPSYYRSADVCVVPSVYDNSPYTCLEAMCCGRPVIGTSAGGTREYIVHGESGLIIPPRDPQAIARAINELLADDKKRSLLARNARQRVLDCFQRKEIARQTAQLYEEAITNFTRRRQVGGVYRKDASQALADTDVFLSACDRMMYDFLFQESIAFRVKHWLHALKTRPRFYMAKVIVRMATALFGQHSSKLPLVRDLQEQIDAKHREVLEKQLTFASNAPLVSERPDASVTTTVHR